MTARNDAMTARNHAMAAYELRDTHAPTLQSRSGCCELPSGRGCCELPPVGPTAHELSK